MHRLLRAVAPNPGQLSATALAFVGAVVDAVMLFDPHLLTDQERAAILLAANLGITLGVGLYGYISHQTALAKISRHLALLLGALLLMGVLFAGHNAYAATDLRPAQQSANGCWWSDNEGQVYQDWYGSVSNSVYDSWSGTYRTVNADLMAYRYTGFNGYCYRSYYASVWLNPNNGGANFYNELRVWDCGNLMTTDLTAVNWGTRQDVTPAPTEGDITEYVVLPSGEGRNLGFWQYSFPSGQLCLPQADNWSSYASSSTWQYQPTATPNAGELYLYMSNGVQHS